MTQQSNIDFKAVAYITTAGIAGILLGTFLIAPMIAKNKAKKQENKKTLEAKKG